MRQETGSSNHYENELSIQLRLDGVSFSLQRFKQEPYSSKPIHLLSHQTILAPMCEVESRGAEAVIKDSGVSLSLGDKVMVIERDQNAALIAVSSEKAAELLDTFGEDAPFTSPILRTPLNESRHVVLYCAEGLTYINIYSTLSMIFAEVFLSPTINDTLYWLSRIGESVTLDDYTIYVANSDSKSAKYLAKYYSNIEICE